MQIKQHTTNEFLKYKNFLIFYFQIRESPAPLNIPTLTPAPDRVVPLGGPVQGWVGKRAGWGGSFNLKWKSNSIV